MNLRYHKRMTAFLLAFSMILTAPAQLVHAEETGAEEIPAEIINETAEQPGEEIQEEKETPDEVPSEETPVEESEETTNGTESAKETVQEEEESANEPVSEADPTAEPTEETERMEAEAAPMPAFSDSVTVSDHRISVSANENVFPEGAKLQVFQPDSESGTDALASGSEEEEEESDLVTVISYRYDISVLDADGNPVQPAEGTRALVKFALKEADNPNLKVRVNHEGPSGMEELESRREEGAIVVETTGFSEYTVEFYYQKQRFYGIPGSVYPLSKLLEETGFILRKGETVESVSLNDKGNEIAELVVEDGEQAVKIKEDAEPEEKKAELNYRVGPVTYALILAAAQAGSVRYIYRDEKNTKGEERECTSYTRVTDGNKKTSFSNGWYVFDGKMTIRDRAEIHGDNVNFILLDGSDVEFAYGIRIRGSDHLNIYTEKKDLGKLTAKSATSFLFFSTSSNSAIGGNSGDSGGSVAFNGGSISATGNDGGAGIGAGRKGTFGNITVNGGSVRAFGGGDAAGIGGSEYGGAISKIEINGGSVYAEGGSKYGAGIGGGDESADGGKIIINAGTVVAKGGGGPNWHTGTKQGQGAGIGGGSHRTGPYEIIINGGKVDAYGSWEGAGIGGGSKGQAGNITINGGEVNAYSGTESAAIGGGLSAGISPSSKVVINGGTVRAQKGPKSGTDPYYFGAGIGGGKSAGQGGDIIITNGFVVADSKEGAGIGGGSSYGQPGGNVTISGGVVMASSASGAGIGGGGDRDDVSTTSANGVGGTVTVNGGEVYASSTNGGAAIGGGNGRRGGTLTINGGYVFATTSAIQYDWVNRLKTKGGSNASQAGTELIANWLGKKLFSHPVSKSPAAIGGGYIGGDKNQGGNAGTLIMNGGMLMAKSGFDEVAAIGPGSGGKKNDAFEIPDNMMVVAASNIKADLSEMKPVLADERINALKNRPFVYVTYCDHDESIYTRTAQGHISNCKYCKEGTHGEEAHIWDESMLTCTKCGYKRTGEIEAKLAEPRKKYSYTGQEIKPEIIVSAFGRKLTEGTDYTAVYENNINAGEGMVTVTGKGGYSGSRSFYFRIERAELKELLLHRYSYPYRGSAYYFFDASQDNVKATGGIPRKDRDYTIFGDMGTEAGTYYVTAKATENSNFKGSVTAVVRITPMSMDGLTITLPDETYVYDRNEKNPRPTVTNSAGILLREGKDYILRYENNINAGTAKLIVSGNNNYSGRRELSFTIEPAELDGIELSKSLFVYDGKTHKAVVSDVFAGPYEVYSSEYRITGAEGIETGTYTITAAASSPNFKGEVSDTWTILPADAAVFSAVLEKDSYLYNSMPREPEVTVKDGDRVLVKGRDYTVVYKDNIIPGTGKAIVSGKGNYSGTLTLLFTIQKPRLVSATFETDTRVYNGENQSVWVNHIYAQNGDDIARDSAYFRIDGGTAKEVGEHKVIISAKEGGPYQGSLELTWKIIPKQASALKAELAADTFTYDGEAKTPEVTVRDGERVLERETDYTVIYQNHTEAGQARATVLLKNGYEGTIELPFTIQKAEITSLKLSETALIYNGKKQTVTAAEILAGTLSVPESAYTLTGNFAVEPGTYTAVVSARDSSSFTGSARAEWTISPRTASQFEAELSNSIFVYDGLEKKPGVTVRDGTLILTEGEDYTVSYLNNVNAGTGIIRISGIGTYSGSKDFEFTIQKAEIDAVDLTDQVLIYDGGEKSPGIVGVYADQLELDESDYTVSGDTASKAGQYDLTVMAKEESNFTGSIDVTWAIVPADASVFTAEIRPQDYTYDGAEKKPAVEVKDGGRILTEEEDYVIAYQNNVDAGTGKVIVSGVGNYQGTRTFPFHIDPAPLTSAVLESNELTWNGTSQSVSLKEVKAGNLSVPEEALTFSGNTGTEAGSYTAVISAKDSSNYKGTIHAQWRISRRDIQDFTAELSEKEFIYDGTEKRPSVTVTKDDLVLKEGEDFTVLYSGNQNAGRAEALITGTGNCTGSIHVPFTISKAEITAVILKEDRFEYNGMRQTAEILAISAGSLDVSESDVIVSGSDGTNAGEYSLKVQAKENGNYSGSATANWTISVQSMDGFSVEVSPSSYVYDGSEKTPEVTVKTGSRVLKEGSDYTVEYQNNINAGSARVLISGIGNYSGTQEIGFVIEKAELDAAELDESVFRYDGNEHTARITGVWADALEVPLESCLVSGITGTNVGTYEVTVTAKEESNYRGTVHEDWYITESDAGLFDVSVSPTEYTYDGSEKTPSVTVRDGERVLKEDSDYTLEYLDNINAGTGRVKVTGRGGYKGTKTLTFVIHKAELTSVTLDKDTLVYDGSTLTAGIKEVKADGVPASVPVDQYIVSGNTAVNAGTYTVTVTASDNKNFKGSVKAEYTVIARSGAEFSTVLNPDRYIYDGSAKTPEAVISDGSRILTENVDYTLSYRNHVNAGQAQAVITFIGNYSGQKEVPYTIAPAEIDQVILPEETLIYNGEIQKIKIQKVLAGTLEVPTEEYTVTGDSEKNAGSYTLQVQAKENGNFTGSKSVEWKIEGKSAADFTVSLDPASFVYDGKEKKPGAEVRDGVVILSEGRDYTLSYENNVNAGQAKGIISGKGDYTGRKEVLFAIRPAEVDTVDLETNALEYNRMEQTIRVLNVYADEIALNEDEYTVNGNTGTDAGDYEVTVTAKPGGNFTGSVTAPWVILEAEEKSFEVELEQTEYVYDGTARTPEVTVRDRSAVLREGEDYFVEYADNINAGTAKVMVSGIGNYRGTKILSFRINRAVIDAVQLESNELSYTGTNLSPLITEVKAGNLTVPEDAYSISGNTKVRAGAYVMTITAKDDGNYTGSLKRTWRINPRSILSFEAKLSEDSFVYDGSEKKPSAMVTDGSVTLQEGVDYSITYYNHINAGKASAIVRGQGNYTDAKELPFTIQKAELDGVDLSNSLLIYNGEEQSVMPVNVWADGRRVPQSAWTVSGNTKADAGDYELSVSANPDGNYRGVVRVPWSILPAEAKRFDVLLAETEYVYDGTAKEPDVLVTDGGILLEEDRDYTLEYSDNTEAGTAKVTVIGTGDYQGKRVVSFTIRKAEITSVLLENTILTYNGEVQKAAIGGVYAKDILLDETEYYEEGDEAVEAGEYIVTVTAADDSSFTGSASASFRIVPQSIQALAGSVSPSFFTYDGTEKKPQVTVRDDNGRMLSLNKDYTLSYENNINIGQASAVITGIGSYTGSLTLPFVIVKAAITSAELIQEELTYTGSPQTPSLKEVKAGNLFLKESEYEVTAAEETEVGTYDLTVTAKEDSNYSGTIQLPWRITAKDQADLSIELSPDTFVYDGNEKEPSVIVKDGSRILSETEYSVEYRDHVNAGKARALIRLSGNYSGEREVPFTIEKAAIDTVILAENDLTYSGSKQTVTVSSVRAGALELSSSDYTFQGNEGVNEGTYTFTVTASDSSNFQGTFSTEWKIVAKNIRDLTAVLEESEYVYDNAAKTPAVTVRNGLDVLAEGTDFTVSYQDNIEAGTARVILSGMGNYKGTKELTFPIQKAELDGAVLEESLFIYSGSLQKAEVSEIYTDTLKVPSSECEISGDTGTDAGEYELTITAKEDSNYRGSLTLDWWILPEGAEVFTASLSPAEFTYDTTEHRPSVTVKSGSKTLVENTDYTLSYQDGTNAGTGRVKVRGIGNYSGERLLTFVINKAELSEVKLKETELIYTGEEQKAEVTEVKAGNLTVPASDYTISGMIADEAGDYQVLIRAKDDSNFKGSLRADYRIGKKNISEIEAYLDETEFVFDQTAKKPEVTLLHGGYLLEEGTDYTVEYADNVHAGTGRAVISGIGNYSGVKELTFTIAKAEIDEADLSEVWLEYTGEEQMAVVTSVRAGHLLVPETDYVVSGNRATEAGDYEVTVTAVENSDYTGSITVPYTILPTDAQVFEAWLEEDEFVYDGTEKKPRAVVIDSQHETLLEEGKDYTVTYTDTVNAGKAKAVIRGKGNYQGSIVLGYTIEKAEIDAAVLKESILVYNGNNQTVQVISVKAGSLDVREEDYSISGNTARQAGSYQLTIRAKNSSNFTGTLNVPYVIAAEDSGVFDAVLEGGPYVYDGKAKLPSVTVKDRRTKEELVRDTDYVLSYQDNIEAGNAAVLISGRGNYSGTIALSFVIEKAELSSVTLKEEELIYSGSAQKATVSLVKAGDLEVPSSDYLVSGNTAEAAGSYTLTVTARPDSSYKGTVTAGYRILPGNAEDVTVLFDDSDYIYDGTQKKPVPVLVQGNRILSEGSDYTVRYGENKEAGHGQIIIMLAGNYEGELEFEFEILKAEISDAVLGETTLRYSGSEQSVTIQDVLADQLHVPSSDWVITGNTAVNTGTYKLKITTSETSNFTGELEREFMIVPADADVFTAVLTPQEFVYDGKEKKPSVTVKDGSTVLSDNDYTVEYAENIHAGTGRVTIRGKGNYTGVKELTFRIARAPLKTVFLLQPDLFFNGEIQSPEIWKVMAETAEAPSDTWTVHGNRAVEPGNYTLTVTAKDGTDFTGSASAEFRIIPEEDSYYFTEETELWVRGSKKDAVFTIKRQTMDHRTFEWFDHLEIDGERLRDGDYDRESGSVTVSIHSSYLSKLKDGRHRLKAAFRDGEVTTDFTVITKSHDSGETEDSSTMDRYIPPYQPQSIKPSQVVNTSDSIHLTQHAWTLAFSMMTGILSFLILQRNRRR